MNNSLTQVQASLAIYESIFQKMGQPPDPALQGEFDQTKQRTAERQSRTRLQLQGRKVDQQQTQQN
jgi:hypothetical protein